MLYYIAKEAVRKTFLYFIQTSDRSIPGDIHPKQPLGKTTDNEQEQVACFMLRLYVLYGNFISIWKN